MYAALGLAARQTDAAAAPLPLLLLLLKLVLATARVMMNAMIQATAVADSMMLDAPMMRDVDHQLALTSLTRQSESCHVCTPLLLC